MDSLEKNDAFYLGKTLNPTTGKPTDKLLYDSKNFNTHAVCVGMTGSGKTGLGISLLEEAGLDKIPAIIIDPKGDLTNLLLTFPDLSPEEFKPWVDESEAQRKGMSLQEYSEYISKTWKDGLASSGEDAQRVKKLRESVDLAVYTPASKLGTPISILNSFTAPSKEEMLDTATIRDKIQSLTSGLLGLLGIAADPIKSREHILISTLINQAWENGVNLNIANLIQQVQQPPFAKIGALPIDTFYPPKERMELSVTLNNLLASPGFKVWLEGEPLDIKQLLYTKEGKPKLSVISIMHLSDSERMFFVTLLLNEFITWMRAQSGTSNLRALLYMDEIFGFFPPTSMPPSKLPMLTLLKQARAFGVGIILVTQNPVDLDYKGLSNCGTWFIGKLQTERDKARVVEGLKSSSNGEFDAKALDKMLSLTGNRTFIMRSIYEKEPIVFQTRWTLSYLRGPLTLTQIATLTGKIGKTVEKESQPNIMQESEQTTLKPIIPRGISEFFARLNNVTQGIRYQPRVAGIAKLHFVDAKNKIDTWQEIGYALASDEDGNNVPWEKGVNIPNLKSQLESTPLPGSSFQDPPAGLTNEKNYRTFEKKLATELYQNEVLTLYHAPSANITSNAGESEEDFKMRAAGSLGSKQSDSVKKIQDQYSDKLSSLKDKIARSEAKVAQKNQKAFTQKLETGVSFLTTILKALFGKKLTQGTITQTGTSLRRATQMNKDSQDATQAESDLSTYREQLTDLETEMKNKIAALTNGTSNIEIEKILIKPRKSDISVEQIALVWWPDSK